MKPKISIITVVYNGEKLLENTILSVINQNYDNIEYIIIDGGSTDHTIDIIKKYANKISYWISEPDKGIYDAMNKGIEVCTGEWILFRNCGDYFASVSDISNVFNKSTYDDYDIIYGDALLWDKYGYWTQKPELQEKNRVGVMPVWHPSTFIRSTIHKQNKFDLKYKLAADHNFILSCKKNGLKFKYVPVILAIFNVGDGASVKGQTISKREHYYIYGGSESNKKALALLKLKILKLKIILSLKQLMPDFLMRYRRKLQGKKTWPNDYTINDMISRAISETNINYFDL